MGKQTHTPGPWEVGTATKTTGITVFAGEDATWARVCRNVRQESDARLIAAAPEMLSVLRDFMVNPVFQVAIGGNPIAVEALMQRANAAIAKATVEQEA